MTPAADEPESARSAGPSGPSEAAGGPARQEPVWADEDRPGEDWADEDRAGEDRAGEDWADPKDEQIWSSDLADWPDEAAAWPGDQEALPDEAGRVDEEGGAGGRRAPEAFAAGFTHRDAARWGQEYATGSPSGFAAGGPADRLEPGPVLAGLAARAWDEGLATLSDDELIGVLTAARRVCSWQTALEFAAVAELDTRRIAQVGDAADPRAAAHTSEELAAALVLTGRAADTLLDLAAGLARLPAVSAALASGVIDRARAVIFVDELAALDDADAAAVAATVLPRAADLTTGQLRAALRRAVLAFDPAAARRRRERAAADARVETWEEASGNGALTGRELSPAGVVAADRHVSALARALKAAGAAGTLDRLRADVFLALLSGRSPESLLPMPGRRETGGAADGEPGSVIPSSGPGLSWPAGPCGTVHLTMPLLSWLGLSDGPGSMDGLGPADAATCRDLAADLSGWPDTRWCLTITAPDGRALGHACAPTSPPERTPPGSTPPGGIPPGVGPPGAGPPGVAPPGVGPPGVSEWLAGLTVQWLEAGTCTHSRESAGYRPAARLRHLIKTRNPTCSFPGCRRPARRCDDDHTVPYEQGGRTCECNLAPLCRRHHRAKQALGWHLEQPRPGVLIWTTPHGRRYVTTAEPYPV